MSRAPEGSVAHAILDLARWAPSGDNTQPWRFEIPSESEILVHGYDTSASCVYDLDAWASQLSHGALLETLAIAATRFGQRAALVETGQRATDHIVYRVRLAPDASAAEDPLVASIATRTVQRRPMRTTVLTAQQKASLEAAARPFAVQWFESLPARREIAALNSANARIRMTIPEAFAVHRRVIAFGAATSDDRLPAASLGADPLLLATMRWGMASWQRMERLNRFIGTAMPRLMLDVLPGLLCSAHFALIAADESQTLDARIEAGRAVQRFWLTAAALGLQQQPSYTPLVFARYARERRPFTRVERAQRDAERIACRLDRLLDESRARRTVWLGRLGPAAPVKGRSLRLSLDRLIVSRAPEHLDSPLDAGSR